MIITGITLPLYQVTDPNYLASYRDMYHLHGLITTSLGLNIPVDGRHFFEGIMRVRCVASLSPTLSRESIVHRRPSLMDSREAMLLGNYNSTFSKETQAINNFLILSEKLSASLELSSNSCPDSNFNYQCYQLASSERTKSF